MWVSLDQFGRVLLDATLATTAMMSVVVLLLLLCRQPARRITVARPALLLATLMMPLVAWNPLPRFNPFGWLLGSGGASAGIAAGWWLVPWALRGLSLAYLAILAIGLVWLLLGLWGIARLLRKSEGPQARTRALYESVIRQSGHASHAPELRVSRRVQRPVLVSLLRPYILIPPSFEEPRVDPESLRWALVHELAHAQESHSHLMVLASLAQTVWFFLPFLHWLRGQLSLDQEFLADHRAVALAGSSASYASRLVTLADAGGVRASGVGALSGAVTGDGGAGRSLLSPLLQRVMILLRAPFPLEARPPRHWSLLAPLFVLVMGGLSACLTLFSPTTRAFATGVPGATSQASRSFQIDYFLATPRGTHASGRSLPYVLPLPLPLQFDLSVEVQLSREALSRMRLAGILLNQPATVGTELRDQLPPPATSSDLHLVRIHRVNDRIELVVDDRSSALDPSTATLTEWLTVEPPSDQTAVLRHLRMTW